MLYSGHPSPIRARTGVVSVEHDTRISEVLWLTSADGIMLMLIPSMIRVWYYPSSTSTTKALLSGPDPPVIIVQTHSWNQPDNNPQKKVVKNSVALKKIINVVLLSKVINRTYEYNNLFNNKYVVKLIKSVLFTESY